VLPSTENLPQIIAMIKESRTALQCVIMMTMQMLPGQSVSQALLMTLNNWKWVDQ
jgi:hypothetical protein